LVGGCPIRFLGHALQIVKPSFSLARALEKKPDFSPQYIQRFTVKPLATLEGNVIQHKQNGVLLGHKDYLNLVDTSGRNQRKDKRGFITDTFLPILQRLAIDADEWIENTQKFEELFYKKFYYRRKTA
jgi:hypothetical protein